MFRGFYNLASGILSQNRNLNVIGSNMVNVTTPGYKSDKFISSAFREEMLYRTGNKDKSNPAPLNNVSMLRAARDTVTDYGQGGFEDTGNPWDVALASPGFFTIQTQQGNNVYTRNGAFSIDDQGYLSLPGVGRVLGEGGGLIQIPGDDFYLDQTGTIYWPSQASKGPQGEDIQPQAVGKVSVVDFADRNQMVKAQDGVFQAGAGGQPVEAAFLWKTLERSNVDPIQEMASMLATQKAMQSSAQMLKMYDQLMGKISGEIGRL